MKEETKRKLESIKELYSDGSAFVFDVSRDYTKLIEEKDFLNHPIFKNFVEDITKQINGLNTLLMNDESLSDKQRDRIFAERRALKVIIRHLSVEVKDSALLALEELIDSKLN